MDKDLLALSNINWEEHCNTVLVLIQRISQQPNGISALMEWASAHEGTDIEYRLVKEAMKSDKNMLQRVNFSRCP